MEVIIIIALAFFGLCLCVLFKPLIDRIKNAEKFEEDASSLIKKIKLIKEKENNNDSLDITDLLYVLSELSRLESTAWQSFAKIVQEKYNNLVRETRDLYGVYNKKLCKKMFV